MIRHYHFCVRAYTWVATYAQGCCWAGQASLAGCFLHFLEQGGTEKVKGEQPVAQWAGRKEGSTAGYTKAIRVQAPECLWWLRTQVVPPQPLGNVQSCWGSSGRGFRELGTEGSSSELQEKTSHQRTVSIAGPLAQGQSSGHHKGQASVQGRLAEGRGGWLGWLCRGLQ